MRYTSIPVQVARKRLAARLIAVAAGVLLANACSPGAGGARMTASEKKAVADSLKRLVVNTYDLSKPEPVKRLMSLYPDTGRVISASGGVTTTTRPKLEEGIKAFWTYVGQNMRNPVWEWTSMNIDVLAPDAAVMTSTYRIPHRTPAGMDHVIAGAWTAVFQNRGGRWVIIQEHLSDVQSNPNLQMNQMDMTTPANSTRPAPAGSHESP
jgi:ketosteroid isomerase-like protein